MKIEKGTKLVVRHKRKGTFLAIANKDFDTDDEWYSVILDEPFLEGEVHVWLRGEEVPTRKGIAEVDVRVGI